MRSVHFHKLHLVEKYGTAKASTKTEINNYIHGRACSCKYSIGSSISQSAAVITPTLISNNPDITIQKFSSTGIIYPEKITNNIFIPPGCKRSDLGYLEIKPEIRTACRNFHECG